MAYLGLWFSGGYRKPGSGGIRHFAIFVQGAGFQKLRLVAIIGELLSGKFAPGHNWR